VRELRLGTLWLVLGLILVAAVLTLSLLPGADLPIQGFNDKLNHALGFFAMTAWFCGLYPRRRWILVCGAMFALGLLIEVLQGWMAVGRTAELPDVAADIAGIAAALVISALGVDSWPVWCERLLVRPARHL